MTNQTAKTELLYNVISICRSAHTCHWFITLLIYLFIMPKRHAKLQYKTHDAVTTSASCGSCPQAIFLALLVGHERSMIKH